MSRLPLLVLFAALLGGCEPEPTPPPSGTWSLVASGRPEALLSVRGRSHRDVFAVGMDRGRGPELLHYDGLGWSELVPGMRFDAWAVLPLPNGEALMAGSNA